MAKKIATIRAWYAAGSQYVFWDVSQINDPLYEYPIGHPPVSDISDICVLSYNNELRYPEIDTDIYWDTDVADGYVVGIVNTAAPDYYKVAKLTSAGVGSSPAAPITNPTYYPALPYPTGPSILINPNKADGIATTFNKIRTTGIASVYCESAVSPGDTVYVSLNTFGMVSSVFPTLQNEYIIAVGTSLSYKSAGMFASPSKIDIVIKIEPVLFLNQDLI